MNGDLDIFGENIKKQFPFFRNNSEIVFLDNASTSQKPDIVLDAMQKYYTQDCANSGRGDYALAGKARLNIEAVRKKVARFLGIARPNELAFVSGATEAMNLMALSFGLAALQDQDEIILCMEEHASTILPWLNVVEILGSFGKKIIIKKIQLHPVGDYDLKAFEKLITSRTQLIVGTDVHNIYGLRMGLEKIVGGLPANILTILDISQSVGHLPIDVEKLGVDGVVFSGHKMFAGTGIGGLWAGSKLFPLLAKAKVGSTLVPQEVSVKNHFEAGTPNIAGILSLGAAVDFIEKIGLENIEKYLFELTSYLLEALKKLPSVEFLPGPGKAQCSMGFGIISFKITGFQAADIGMILNDYGICVRTGFACNAGAKEQDFIRVSLQIYNTSKDIDYLIKILTSIIFVTKPDSW